MIPPIYRSIGTITGLPLNWRDEITGALPRAVNAYLNHRIDGTPLNAEDLELVRRFMEHYINAPCWNHMDDSEMAAELAALRKDVRTLKTAEEMGAWIGRCLDVAIDPL
jgi:hypothetical protein